MVEIYVIKIINMNKSITLLIIIESLKRICTLLINKRENE